MPNCVLGRVQPPTPPCRAKSSAGYFGAFRRTDVFVATLAATSASRLTGHAHLMRTMPCIPTACAFLASVLRQCHADTGGGWWRVAQYTHGRAPHAAVHPAHMGCQWPLHRHPQGDAACAQRSGRPLQQFSLVVVASFWVCQCTKPRENTAGGVCGWQRMGTIPGVYLRCGG
jgi:hypothetical protein